MLTKTPGRQQSSPNKSHVTKVQQYTVLGGFDEQSSSAELIAHTRKWGGDSPLPRATPREGSLESAAPEERFPAQTANRMRERTPLAGEPSPPLQYPSSEKGTKLSLKSEDVARAGLSGGIGLGLGTIVRSAHWTVRRACLRTSMAHADVHKHMQAKSRATIDTGVHAAKLKMRVAGYVRDRVNSRQSVGTSGGEYNCM